MPGTILYEVTDAVGVVTLNRPESLNALDAASLNSLRDAIRHAALDAAVRCVVITGSGRAFCAGGDIKGMSFDGSGARPGEGDAFASLRDQEDSSLLLQEMAKPTIAAVNGPAAGAGLSIALAADLRVASDQAKFTTAFSRIGFSGDFGGTWLMQRLLGPAKARELYFLSPTVEADEALRLGLVSRVVPHESLMDETMALARRLATGPTLAYARIKENLAFGATHTLAETLGLEAQNMIASRLTEDHRNAARAFLEKREPSFSGR